MNVKRQNMNTQTRKTKTKGGKTPSADSKLLQKYTNWLQRLKKTWQKEGHHSKMLPDDYKDTPKNYRQTLRVHEKAPWGLHEWHCGFFKKKFPVTTLNWLKKKKITRRYKVCSCEISWETQFSHYTIQKSITTKGLKWNRNPEVLWF